jgi:hypothetical protein
MSMIVMSQTDLHPKTNRTNQYALMTLPSRPCQTPTCQLPLTLTARSLLPSAPSVIIRVPDLPRCGRRLRCATIRSRSWCTVVSTAGRRGRSTNGRCRRGVGTPTTLPGTGRRGADSSRRRRRVGTRGRGIERGRSRCAQPSTRSRRIVWVRAAARAGCVAPAVGAAGTGGRR